MKKFRTIIILTVFVITVMTTVVYAQPWKGWKGSGGWGYKSQYQRMYNPQSVATIKGVVEVVEQITPRGGMSYGIHLKVKTDTAILSVHLGPAWFIERQDIKIDSMEKTIRILPVLRSDSNIFPNSSSSQEYSKGYPVSNSSQIPFTNLTVSGILPFPILMRSTPSQFPRIK